MRETIIDEPTEYLEIKWDKERFALIRTLTVGTTTIILNTREANKIAKFIKEWDNANW